MTEDRSANTTPKPRRKRVSFSDVVSYNSPPPSPNPDPYLPTPRAGRARSLSLPNAAARSSGASHSTGKKKHRCSKSGSKRQGRRRSALSDRTNSKTLSSSLILSPEDELKILSDHVTPAMASCIRTSSYIVDNDDVAVQPWARRGRKKKNKKPQPTKEEALKQLEKLHRDGSLSHMKQYVVSQLALHVCEEVALEGMLDALDAARVHGLYALGRGGDCGRAMLRRAEGEERDAALLRVAARRELGVVAVGRELRDERRRLRKARAKLRAFVRAHGGDAHAPCEEEGVRVLAARIQTGRREGWA